LLPPNQRRGQRQVEGQKWLLSAGSKKKSNKKKKSSRMLVEKRSLFDTLQRFGKSLE
jgi:hypothetical protein